VKSVRVEICRGTSCHLLGSGELLDALDSLPSAQRDQVELCMVDCLKGCRQGANARFNGTVVPGLTPETFVEMLGELFCLSQD
jgi:NADH:ubiquinone oxidoreductase subunit E